MCVCASHFLPTGSFTSRVRQSSPSRHASNHDSSSSYNLSSMSFTSRLEDRPLVNSVPLYQLPPDQRSGDHNGNNTQSARRNDCFPRYDHCEPETTVYLNQLRKSIKQIDTFFVNKAKEARRLRRMRREWKSVAIVMDRIFFTLYLAIIITSITLMFPRP